MADETLRFKVSLDTTEFKAAISGIEKEFENASQSAIASFQNLTKEKIEPIVKFGADIKDVEVQLKATTSLEQKIARERAKEEKKRAADDKKNEKDRLDAIKRQAAEDRKRNKELQAGIKRVQDAFKKQNQEEGKAEYNRKKARASWAAILDTAEKVLGVQKGSVNQLTSELNFQKQKLGDLVRGTEEYEKQLALVKQLQGERAIQISGPEGLKAEAFAQLAEGFSKVAFIGQQVAQIIGSITSSFEALFDRATKLQSLELTFKSIGVGASGANVALQESQRIALGLGADINTVRDSFAKLSPVILATGGGMDDVSAITEALSSRFSAFGKSAEESRRIMNGVIQAFGKGKLQAEELTQQIGEADPAFKTDLAQAIGKTVAQLEEMVKNGELTSDVLMQTIPLLGKSAILYGRLGETASSAVAALRTQPELLQQVRTQIENLNQLNFEVLADAFAPVLGSILQVQAAFADFFSFILSGSTFQFLAEVLINIGEIIANVTSAVLYLATGVTLFLNVAFGIIDFFDQFLPITELVALALMGVATAITAISIQAAIAAISQFAASITALLAPLGLFSTGLLAANGGMALFIKSLIAKTALTYQAIIASGSYSVALGAVAGSLWSTIAGMVKYVATLALKIAATVAAGTASFVLGGALSFLSTAFTATAAAAGALLITLGPILIPLAALAGAIALVTYAWDQNNKASKEAKDLAEQNRSAIDKLNKSLETTGLQAAAYTTIQERAERTGESYLSYTNRQNQTYNQLKINTESYNKALGANIDKLKEVIDKSDDSEESNKRILDSSKAIIASIDGELIGYKSRLNALKAMKAAGSEMTAAEKAQIGVLENAVQALEQKKSSLYELVPGLQTATKETEELTQAASELEEELKKLADATKQVYAEKQAAAREAYQDEKDAIDDAKRAAKEARDETIADLQEKKTKEKEASDKKIEGIKKEEEARKKAHDKYMEDQATEKQRVSEFYKKVQEEIAKNTKLENERHTKALEALNVELAKIQEIGDARLSKLKSELDVITQTSEARIAALEEEKRAIDEKEQREAEEKRKAQEIADLKKQAVQAETEEERKAAEEKLAALDAEAKKEAEIAAQKAAIDAQIEQERQNAEQLRIAKQQELANAEKAIAQEIADKKRQIAEEEEANTTKLAELKAQADQAELQRKFELEELEKRVAEEKRLYKEAQAEFDKRVDEEKEKALLEEKELEKQIADEKKAAKQEEEEFNKKAREAERRFRQQMKDLKDEEQEQLEKIKKRQQEVLKLLEKKTKEAENYAEQVERAEKAQRRLNDLIAKQPKRGSGRFAGGPVTGGATYTVNELGQEGFLTRSGVLSAIEAPSWGQWKAPGAGTVIPAHIMAGLNIPKGGVPVNTVALGNTDGSSGLLGAIRGALSGNVSRVTNNVTISSDKPVSDASRMMVEMSKMRLRKR